MKKNKKHKKIRTSRTKENRLKHRRNKRNDKSTQNQIKAPKVLQAVLRNFVRGSSYFSPVNKKLLRMLIFLIKFNLFAIPLYLIIISGFQWDFLIDTTAGITYSIVKITGIDATMEDSYITVPMEGGHFIASVGWDCTGWKSMLALFALIFATDFSLRRKMTGLILIPVIYIINLVRIWFMFYFVSSFGIAHYDFIHATLWSWGLITALLILWVIWLKKDISKLKIPTRIK